MVLKCFYILKSRSVAILNLVILGVIAFAILITGGVKGALATTSTTPITDFKTEHNEVSITVNVYEFTDLEGMMSKLGTRKATFFISEEYMERFPDKVRMLSDTGQDIGILLGDMRTMSDNEINNVLASRVEHMAQIIGRNTEITRFNHNRYNTDILHAVYAVGLVPVQWSADDTDERFSAGDIILMTGEVNTQSFFGKAEADGFNFKTVSEVIKKNMAHTTVREVCAV
jgi:hypothetical protein